LLVKLEIRYSHTSQRGIDRSLAFKYQCFQQVEYYTTYKHNNSDRIDGVHNLQIKTGWPVGILFPEKIHEQI